MRKRNLFSWILIGFEFLSGRLILAAEVSPALTPTFLDFEQASKMALGENPDLKSLRYQQESQSLKARQALGPNNPVLTLNKNDITGFSLAAEGASSIYNVSFTLGFPGKALSQSASLRHQSEATSEQALSKEIDILSALSNNYVSLTANEKLYQFLKEEGAKAAELAKLLEKKYAAAQAAQVDLLNARVVVANLQQDILVNRDDKQSLLTQFLNLIKRPASKDLLPLIPNDIEVPALNFNLEELNSLMLKNRPLLKAARQQVEAAEATLTNMSLSPLPDFQLSASMNIYHLPSAQPISGVSRDYSMGLGFSIPLFFPFNELSGIRAAIKDRNSAETQEESQRLSSVADLQSLYTHFFSNQREMENLTNLVLPAAKASYDLMRTTYSLGRADYFRLNETRSAWVQAQKDLIQKKVNAAQLFNQITQQVGCDLTGRQSPHACH